MVILPTPRIPQLTQRYTNQLPPAGLLVLQKPKRILPPAASEGNGLPPDTITPYSGIYDENGKLPAPKSSLTFLAYA